MRIKDSSGVYDQFEIDAFWSKSYCKIRYAFSNNGGRLIIENIPGLTNSLAMGDHDSILEKVAQHLLNEKILIPAGLKACARKVFSTKNKYRYFVLEAGVSFLLSNVDVFVHYPGGSKLSDNSSVARIKVHEDGESYLSYSYYDDEWRGSKEANPLTYMS